MKIAVLGSGLMGRVIAMRLYQEGISNITLVEKNAANSSQSPANIAAGMLSGYTESVMGGKLIFQLGQMSATLWNNYLTALNVPHLLNNQGSLLVASPQFFAEISHYINKISFNTEVNDFYRILNKEQLNILEPELNYNRAYYLPDEGMVDAAKVMASLAYFLLDKVDWRTGCEISSVNTNGTIIIQDKMEKFELIIDCRGVGAKEVYPEIRGVRGEIIRVHAPEVNLKRPIRLFHPRQNIYVVPYADNNYAIGATELETLDYSPVSVRSTLELLSCAYSIHSGFAEARITSMDSNCRPALADNLPHIKWQDKLIAVNGLYRHGFLLAPALAEEVITLFNNFPRKFSQIWS